MGSGWSNGLHRSRVLAPYGIYKVDLTAPV